MFSQFLTIKLSILRNIFEMQSPTSSASDGVHSLQGLWEWE